MPPTKKFSRCLWLEYPPTVAHRPIVYELGHKFAVITNILQASVTDNIGLLSLELVGDAQEINRAIRWLRRVGVIVEETDVRVTKAPERVSRERSN
jgi:ABC-type methionine transport system ATPase subunit